MFEDLIRPKEKQFDTGKFAGMDGICIFCPNDHGNPLVFEDCTNFEKDVPERIHKWATVCKYHVRDKDCTFHR